MYLEIYRRQKILLPISQPIVAVLSVHKGSPLGSDRETEGIGDKSL